MASSFEVFRKYQRSLLVFVAILAMLAFFVLPPILDALQNSGGGGANPVVVAWKGREIREQELARVRQVRRFVNDVLYLTRVELGLEPPDLPGFSEDEAGVVNDLVLAREAEASGIVVDNDAVNRFLKSWTQGRIPAKVLAEVIAQGRQEKPTVSEADVFESLRTSLAANRLAGLFRAGLVGDPPAGRWDVFRRLEQEATIEVVPVVVESLVRDDPKPTEAELRDLFDRAKDRFPRDRSPEPGFKEPQRISCQWLVADVKKLQAEAAEKVTDEEIAKFYEANKDVLYPASPGGEDALDGASAPAAAGGPPASGFGPAVATPEKPAAAQTPVTPAQPAGDEPQPESTDGAPTPAVPAPTEPQSTLSGRASFVPVKFRQPGSAPGATGQPAAAEPAAGAVPAAGPEVPPAGDREGAALQYEPLDKVRDDVRQRLAKQAVDKTLRAVENEVSQSRSKKRSDADGQAQTTFDTIAKTHGLEAGHAERLTDGEARQRGGVGTSFRLSFDQRAGRWRPTGWIDLVFVPDAPLWELQQTMDEAGNRYLSWKTEDFPESVPEFDAVRADVERAWRILEARPRAEALAKEIAGEASGGKALADVVAGRDGPKLEIVQIKPFTWLASLSRAATLSQPEGMEMPGEDFMRAVFALEPGGTAVAFNEPRTVCYVIRLVSYSSAEEDLRKRFLEPRDNDRQRIDAVIDAEVNGALGAWMADVVQRAGLDWKRPPRRPREQ